LAGAFAVVKRALGKIQYFWPSRWWLETRRFVLLPQHDLMQVFPFWDVDYCQYGEKGFRKLGFIEMHIFFLTSHVFFPITPGFCDGVHGKNFGQGRKHLGPLAGPFWSASKKLTYLIPRKFVEIASRLLVCF